MGFADEKFFANFGNAQQAKFELAERLIRKYWGTEFFHSLGEQQQVLDFAKRMASKIDKLEAIAGFFGDEYAKFCFTEDIVRQVYREQEPMLKTYAKAHVLSYDSRKEALLQVDNAVLIVVQNLGERSLNKYLLIVHNEGAEKAEEVRTSGELASFKAKYISDYQPDPRTTEPSFSQSIGINGKAAA